MDNRIISFYCENVIKPLEMRKKELEREINSKIFVSRSKKIELKLVSELFYEKLCYLSKLTDELINETTMQ